MSWINRVKTHTLTQFTPMCTTTLFFFNITLDQIHPPTDQNTPIKNFYRQNLKNKNKRVIYFLAREQIKIATVQPHSLR